MAKGKTHVNPMAKAGELDRVLEGQISKFKGKKAQKKEAGSVLKGILGKGE